MERSIYYLRNINAAAVSTAGQFLFVSPRGAVHVLDGVEADRLARIWESLAFPISPEELDALGEGEASALEATLDALVADEVILAGSREELSNKRAREELPQTPLVCQRLVLGITGAAHAFSIVPYVRELCLTFAEEIDVVLTENAQAFVRREALAALGVRVWTDMMDAQGEVSVPHIQLAESAQMVLIFPATAHAIHRLAQGACSDLLSLIVSATTRPVVVVPTMNQNMWCKPAIQRNVSQIRTDGLFVVEPGLGFELAQGRGAKLSVGGVGVGRSMTALCRILETILNLSDL
jgi:3-polyprenyl-4-hydroxybenzoate decarboxylase